jgi:cytochrome c5
MSEQHDEHTSFIKTPKQLAIVVALAHIIPISLIVILTQLVTKSEHIDKRDPAYSDEAIAQRLKPVGQVTIEAPAAAPGAKTGEQVVQQVCAACHASGALNAPKIGDKAAWAPRIKEGYDQLVQHAVKGYKAMPPKGGNASLTDDEVARAVAYLADQAGASFKAPEPKAASAAASTAPAAAPAAAAAPAPAAAAPAAASSGGGDLAKGKQVFSGTCVACHGTGVAGAPKAGDKAVWAPRIATGKDALYKAALHGLNAMPPKGGNMSLSDADVKAAVDYMVSLVK